MAIREMSDITTDLRRSRLTLLGHLHKGADVSALPQEDVRSYMQLAEKAYGRDFESLFHAMNLEVRIASGDGLYITNETPILTRDIPELACLEAFLRMNGSFLPSSVYDPELPGFKDPANLEIDTGNLRGSLRGMDSNSSMSFYTLTGLKPDGRLFLESIGYNINDFLKRLIENRPNTSVKSELGVDESGRIVERSNRSNYPVVWFLGNVARHYAEMNDKFIEAKEALDNQKSIKFRDLLPGNRKKRLQPFEETEKGARKQYEMYKEKFDRIVEAYCSSVDKNDARAISDQIKSGLQNYFFFSSLLYPIANKLPEDAASAIKEVIISEAGNGKPGLFLRDSSAHQMLSSDDLDKIFIALKHKIEDVGCTRNPLDFIMDPLYRFVGRSGLTGRFSGNSELLELYQKSHPSATNVNF